MSNIIIKDANSVNQYLAGIGAGTDADPIQPIHSVRTLEDAVAMYELAEYGYLDKFGVNPSIAIGVPEDVWEGGGEYPFSTTADIVSICSDNAADNQDIEIIGQIDDYTEVTQTVTLNGTTRVALSTPLMRVYRAQNVSASEFVGEVQIYTGVGGHGTGTLKAVVFAENQQTQMAIWTVPRGKVAFLYRGELGISWTGGGPSDYEVAIMAYQSRRVGEIFKTKKTVTLTTHGNTVYQDRRIFPDIIPSGTDLRIRVMSVTDTMGAWSAFDVMLVDESQFDAAFLAAIGQLGY